MIKSIPIRLFIFVVRMSQNIKALGILDLESTLAMLDDE